MGVFGAVLVCTVAILLLENLARLMGPLQHVRDPLMLLARLSLCLLPEYLGIGILIALFLSVALAIRALTLNGEWQTFAASGLSSARLCLVPLLLGIFCATVELSIDFQLRPTGEHRLDRLFSDVRRGLYGIGGDVREIVRLDDGTVIVADGFDRLTGRLANVFIAGRKTIFTARSAFASLDGSGNVRLLLEEGQRIVPRHDERFEPVNFGRLRIRLLRSDHEPWRGAAETPDRLAYGDLVHQIDLESTAHAGIRKALASFVARCAYSAFALFIPFLALALGTLPMRRRSFYGIGAGILAIVGYIRLVDFVETATVTHPLIGFGALIGASGAVVAIVWRGESQHGPGFVESWLATRLVEPVVMRVANLRTLSNA